MNENSIGSVIPVRNDVNAIEARRPETALRRSGRAARYMARHAAGKPNIMTGHEGTRRRVALEESIQIAGHAVVFAKELPGDVVENVMEARDDQDAVEHPIHEQADVA